MLIGLSIAYSVIEVPLLNLVGNTPMVNVGGVSLKLEYMNPTGSHKDRTALYMIRDASRNLRKGGYVIEYTSGNTGISVAWVAGILGYRAIILVPQKTSINKVNMIKLFNGEVKFVAENEDGHMLAEDLAKRTEGVFLAQTRNMANFKAHYETTGPEIARETKHANCFVMGAGTAGTVYGAGKYLKEKLDMRVYALIPRGSYVQEILTGSSENDREIMEGFSYHNFSELLHRAIEEEVIDEIIYVSSKEAIEGMRLLWNRGIPGGPTAGANFYHALKLMKQGCRPVTLVPDSIIRYPHLLEEIVREKMKSEEIEKSEN